MVIDRETFGDLATQLERASEGILEVTRRCVALCEGTVDLSDQTTWVGLVEQLLSVNLALTAMEQMLRALLEANRQEQTLQKNRGT